METASTFARKGVSLIEVLIGMIIVVIASIGTLTYFAHGLGNINKQGNRRGALERARERLEQLMSAPLADFPPETNGALHWCETGNPCRWSQNSWQASNSPIAHDTPVTVGTVGGMRQEIHCQWVDDQTIGTSGLEAIELGVKIWFKPGADNDFNRVYLKTLRSP